MFFGRVCVRNGLFGNGDTLVLHFGVFEKKFSTPGEGGRWTCLRRCVGRLWSVLFFLSGRKKKKVLKYFDQTEHQGIRRDGSAVNNM